MTAGMHKSPERRLVARKMSDDVVYRAAGEVFGQHFLESLPARGRERVHEGEMNVRGGGETPGLWFLPKQDGGGGAGEILDGLSICGNPPVDFRIGGGHSAGLSAGGLRG